METIYVNNNGNVLENKGYVLEAGNRGHLYGDGLFETIRVVNGKPVNVDVHISRLLDGMSALKMRIPTYLTKEFFQEKFNELIKKSKIKHGAKIRLSIDRVSGGIFQPSTNEVTYFIEIYPLSNNLFTLNQKGLEVDLYNTIKKDKINISNFKTKSALLNVMASIEAKEKGLDSMLLTCRNGYVIEGISSNLFITSNSVLYTPGIDEGCVGGTMRMKVINLAIENNLRVYESSITPQHLLMADEVFLTNAIVGIQWVSGFRTKRYTNTISARLLSLLNQSLISE